MRLFIKIAYMMLTLSIELESNFESNFKSNESYVESIGNVDKFNDDKLS